MNVDLDIDMKNRDNETIDPLQVILGYAHLFFHDTANIDNTIVCLTDVGLTMLSGRTHCLWSRPPPHN